MLYNSFVAKRKPSNNVMEDRKSLFLVIWYCRSEENIAKSHSWVLSDEWEIGHKFEVINCKTMGCTSMVLKWDLDFWVRFMISIIL